jgi:NMD protein affecting ribosome stability and mRNA decay
MINVPSAVVLLFLAFPPHVLGQGTFGFGNKRSELTRVIEGDIEFVQCEFCQMAAKHLRRSIVMMRAAMPSWVKKLPEEAVEAFLDRVCNSNQETGEWLTKMDVQQEGESLVIKQMPEV